MGLLAWVQKQFGISINVKNESNQNSAHVKRDKFMPVRGTLSNSKAKKLLNYSSRWNLEKGYIRYIKWYKKIFAAS